MKNNLFYPILFICLLLPTITFSGTIEIKKGDWNITFDEENKTFDYRYKDKVILENAYPTALYDGFGKKDEKITSSSFSVYSTSSRDVEDNFGKGEVITFRFEDENSGLIMEQDFYFYSDYPYLITQLRLTGTEEIASNYLAPVVMETSIPYFSASAKNRMLRIPWDNDGFIRYECQKLETEITSYGVTSVYNEAENGLVIGAIEHDTWKTAINLKGSNNQSIEYLVCYSGASTGETRDKLPHGKVKRNEVKSAKMFLGYYEDWRMGMEDYGRANTLIVPARETWKKGTPFGWNSWAVIAEKLNYTAAVEVSDYYKEILFEEGFHNDQGVVIIDLDSYWDNMSSFNIKQFATRCKNNGQVPGIYWCPFSYWGGTGNLDSHVEGTNNRYRYRDIMLPVNGEAHSQGGVCLDPTHPGSKERVEYMIQRFKDWGFEYVKLDFVTNGAIQGDSYYNPEVTTGVQAYNEGFQHLIDVAGDDMFIALSIAPMFPYQYGNSRRISCDAWGRIGDTEYVMNALSYGWWTDQFYQFNDPDHLLLQSDSKESLGANRARATSGAITGMSLYGDNFSTSYTDRGNPTVSKERALQIMNNKDMIEMANLGVSFKPVYGSSITATNKAENFFMHHTDKYLYVACINYNAAIIALNGTIPLEKLNMDPDDILSIKELWTGTEIELQNNELPYSISPCDAKVYRIKKKSGNVAIPVIEKKNGIRVYMTSPRVMTVQSEKQINKIDIYNIQGDLLKSSYLENGSDIPIDLNRGIYLVKLYCEDNESLSEKLIVNL